MNLSWLLEIWELSWVFNFDIYFGFLELPPQYLALLTDISQEDNCPIFHGQLFRVLVSQ